MKNLLDIADVMILLGLCSLGYGLYIVAPWVSFSVVGGLLFLLGVYNGHFDKATPSGENR